MNPQTADYSEIPEQEWTPRWNEEQLSNIISQYKGNPSLYPPEVIQQIKHHASYYNKPFYEGDFNITEALGQFGIGLISGFTTYDPGHHPDNEYEAIIRNLGHLIGFVPGITAPLFKGVGLAAQVAKIKSVPMLIADKVMKGAKSIAKPAVTAARAGKVEATQTAANFLTTKAPKHIAEGAFHLGVASGVSAWQQGIDGMMDSFFGGAVAGAGFRAIGNFVKLKGNPKGTKYVRALAGSLFMGLPAQIQGATTPELVYQYLLGAYFGGHERGWRAHGSAQFQQKMIKESEAGNNKLAVSRNPEHAEGFKDLDPEIQKRVMKDAKSRWGDPTTNEGAGLYLIEKLGLGEIVNGEATKEGWDGLKKVIAGEEIATTKQKGKGPVKMAISGAADGADVVWSRLLKNMGVETVQYVPEGKGVGVEKKGIPGVIREVSEKELAEAGPRVVRAAKALNKSSPSDPKSREFIYRNWFQVKFSDSVFGVGSINTNRRTVRGGSGWTVEYAKQLKKPVYFFEQPTKKWFKFDYRLNQFKALDYTPTLTKTPAVIGTRNIWKQGVKAIEDVVSKTFGKKIEEKATKGGVSEEEIVSPGPEMRAKILKAENLLAKYQSEVATYNEAKKELTEKKKKTAKEKAELLQLKKEYKLSAKSQLETEKLLEKMYEVPAGHVLTKKGEIVPEDKNDTDVGMKYDLEVGKRAEQYVKKHIQKLIDTPDNISKRVHTLELSNKLETILNKHVSRGEEPKMDALIGEIEKKFDKIVLSEEATGELKQWLNIKNNAVENRYMNITLDGKNIHIKPMTNKRRMTPAGNRKYQREPEKLIERMFINAGGKLNPELGSLVIADNVTWRNKQGSLEDITFSDLRRKSVSSYNDVIAKLNNKMFKKGFYLFGGRGDADRFYYTKFHPASGKAQMSLNAKFLSTIKTGTKDNNEYIKARDEFAERNKSHMKKPKAKKIFDRAFESNILYDLALNGFPIKMVRKTVEIGEGHMVKKMTPFQKKKKLDEYVKTMFGPGFINGVVGFNKRLQIIMTPSWPGSAELAKTRIKDLNEEGRLNYVIVEDLTEKPEFWRHYGNEDANIKAIRNSLFEENVDGAIVTRDDVVDYMNEDAGMPRSGQNKSFIISPQNNPKTGEPMGALYGKYMNHKAGPKLTAEMKEKGLHYIIYKSSAKQHGTRTIGDYKINDKGKLEIDKESIYSLDPAELKYNYSVKQNAHMWRGEHVIAKQALAHLTQGAYSPVSLDMINDIYEGTIMERFKGKTKANEFLAKAMEEGNEINVTKELIEDVGINELLKAVHSEKGTKFADAAYQRLFKLNSEAIEQSRLEGEITEKQADTMMNELNEFNQATDRMIYQSLLVSRGTKKGALPIMLHKWIRPYRAVMMRNFLVHSISRPKIGNSGNARMRPYDKALRMDFDNVNPRLKELENRDDIFFLDNEYKKMPIETHIKGMERTTLEKLWNKYDAESTSQTTKEQIGEVIRAVVLRVPMDSISGAHALKFRGFTGRDGHGILLHSRAMRQLGGADLDGDEAFMYFGGRNKQGKGKGFKKEWKDVYEANRDEYMKYRHINTGEIITPEQYAKKSKLQKSKGKWLKYIPDPKTGVIVRPDGKYKKMSFRDLLTLSGKDKSLAKALKESKVFQYSPSMRQYISEKAVDGRNTLGPAVSMPQIFKTAHSMMMANEVKGDFYEIWKNEGTARKQKWVRYGVKVEPRTEQEWLRYQRELGSSMVAFASDPMDEVGLKGYEAWYKELWDSYFKITDVKNLSKKGKRKTDKDLLNLDNFHSKFKLRGFKGSSKFPSLLNKVNEMNSALFGKDWTNNKMWEESEIRNKIKFLHDLTPDEMPVLLARMGDTIGMTEPFGDAIAKRVDRKKLIKWYEDMNILAEKEKWLAPIIGRSGFKVPYGEIVDNVLRLKIYELDKIDHYSSSKDDFLKAIKGTSYAKDNELMLRLTKSESKLKKLGLTPVEQPERTRIIKEMVTRTDEFITNDIHDMISLRLIVPHVKKLRDNLTGKALKDFDKMVKDVFKKSDFFKQSSAMKRKQRKEVDDYYEKMNVMPEELQALYESIVKIVPGVKGFKVPTGEEPSSTMDQVALDINMAQYKKTLTPWGKKLFDYFMLGTWDRAHIRRANKIESILKGTNISHPLFHDLIHMVKMAGSQTSLNKVAYGSEAIYDSNVRAFMKDYLDISGEIYKESPKEVENIQKNIENLKEKKEIELGDGTKVEASIFDKNIDPKVEGTYSADLSGFKGLTSGKLDPKDAKVIEELAVNIKYHYPEIGARLGEVVRGIMEKDLNAMNREDYILFNNILKEMRAGTLNQKLDILMGKDPKGRIPDLKGRYYMQFPETVNREVMKYDITWLRNKGAFLAKDGEWKEGPIQKPSWFLQRQTDIIGIMNQQGMQLTEELTGSLNQDLLFMEGIKNNELLRKVAVRKMDYDYEKSSIMKNEKMSPEAKGSAVGDIEKTYKEAVKNAGDMLDATHRIVNDKGERVKANGWEVVEKIMDVYEKSNKKAYELLAGNPESLEPYIIGHWDNAKLEPMIDYTRFMKDMFELYNQGKPIPREFGVDGLRQVARSMSIDLLSKDKKGKEMRDRLISSELKRTKHKHFRGFWPRIFFSGSEVVTALNKRVEQIMKSDMKPAEKDADIKKLVVKHHMLTGDWIDPADGFWEAVNRAELADIVKGVKGRKKRDTMDWWKKDLTIKSMKQRTSYIPGFSIERSTYESYLRNVGDVYYKQLNYLFTRAIIESYKKRAFQKGWYKKNDYPDYRWTDPETGELKKGMSLGQAWETYLKLYAQGAMGNPDIVPDKIYEDPHMKIKGTPYGWWADNKVRDRMNKIKNGLFKGQKLHPKLEKLIDTDFDFNTLRTISNMEAKFELAALLAHPKSMVANIFGGSMHTIQSAGWDYFKKANKIAELQKINPEWTSKEAVQKFVVKHGVIPEFIMYEWGLSPELRTANSRKFIEEAVTKYVGKEPDKQGLRELAKKYQISKPMMDKAALFMSLPETKLRRDSFMAHYLRAYDKFGGAFKSFDHPFLIEYAKKGVKATQFLYNAPYRPAFARTALGKVMTRFQLWSWNAVRFRNDVIREARTRGLRPGTEAFERFKRTAQIDLFVFAMGNIFMYSLFETAMPAPWNWLQDTSDWLFGDETERDRAFFGTWPTSVAPLQMITPPILRFPAAGLTGFIKDDYSKLGDYHVYTALPFGRLGRDFSPWAKGNLLENPMRLLDKWTGFPLTGLQKEAKRNKKEKPYYPWAPSLNTDFDKD